MGPQVVTVDGGNGSATVCVRMCSGVSVVFFSFFLFFFFVFFFNDTATTEIYTLSLHDALPICSCLLLYSHGKGLTTLNYTGAA